jgi:hypothetical protein
VSLISTPEAPAQIATIMYVSKIGGLPSLASPEGIGCIESFMNGSPTLVLATHRYIVVCIGYPSDFRHGTGGGAFRRSLDLGEVARRIGSALALILTSVAGAHLGRSP